MSAWERYISGVFRTLRLDSLKSKIIVFALLATLIPSLSTAVISYRQNKRALTEKISEPFLPVKGATGFGVRLLVDYLEGCASNEG